MSVKEPRNHSVGLTGWAAVGISAVAVWLHGVFLFHAGALWRDEIGTVGVATMPSLQELSRMLEVGSGTPILVPLILRAWTALGFGGDFGLRLWGFIVGLLLLASLWVASWVMGRKPPLVSVGLLAANASFIRWGDSLRAIGLASVFVVLTLVLVWRLVARPGVGRYVAAAFMALLSVQTLYQAAFLILAICVAGCTVCAHSRAWSKCGLVAAVGLPAALSLIPYTGGIRASQDWWKVQRGNIGFELVLNQVWETLGSPYFGWAVVWSVLGIWTIVKGIKAARAEVAVDSKMWLFAAAAFVAGLVVFIGFTSSSGLYPRPWYFVPLMALAAVCLDAVTGLNAGSSPLTRNLTTAGMGLLVLISVPAANRGAKASQTNLDQVAAWISREASPQDMIIIHPWQGGTTFARYYHGAAPWTTVPPLTDYRVQRYDLFKARMSEDNPVLEALQKAEATLKAGNRLWLVGGFKYDGRPPVQMAPAPQNPAGWSEVAYERAWASCFSHLAVTSAVEFSEVTGLASSAVNPYENFPVYVARGKK